MTKLPPKRIGRRCTYCRSSSVQMAISAPNRWFCLACERIQPDPRYPAPVTKGKK